MDLIQEIRDYVKMQPKNADKINDALNKLELELHQKDTLIAMYREVKERHRQWEEVKSVMPSHPEG